MFLKIFLVSIALIALAVAGIAIKMFVIKGGKFEKTCGSVDPESGKIVACTCNNKEDKECDNKSLKEADQQWQLTLK
ncbi:membrane or secreted protein [candidate division KSB1 bacterium]